MAHIAAGHLYRNGAGKEAGSGRAFCLQVYVGVARNRLAARFFVDSAAAKRLITEEFRSYSWLQINQSRMSLYSQSTISRISSSGRTENEDDRDFLQVRIICMHPLQI